MAKTKKKAPHETPAWHKVTMWIKAKPGLDVHDVDGEGKGLDEMLIDVIDGREDADTLNGLILDSTTPRLVAGKGPNSEDDTL